MNVLYVAPDGTVRSGRLVAGGEPPDAVATSLVSRGGAPLAPAEVRALLASGAPTEAERQALWRAHRAGYRAEKA